MTTTTKETVRSELVGYCTRHSERMSDEGWHKTAIVLGVAADEVKRLRLLVEQIGGMVTPTSKIGVLITASETACSHCGKPSTTIVCGVGGCPLGGDL